MKDTGPEVESRFREMMMKKSGEERLEMGFSMFETARRQVIASLRNENPDVDERGIKKHVFLRFYGHEFSEDERERILKWMR